MELRTSKSTARGLHRCTTQWLRTKSGAPWNWSVNYLTKRYGTLLTTVLFTMFSTWFFENVLPDNFCCKWNGATIHQNVFFFLTANIPHEVENHVPLPFYWFLILRGGDFTMLKFLAPSRLRSGTPYWRLDGYGTRDKNGAIKCMWFPMQKLIFWDTGLVPFFLFEESWRVY